MDLRPVIETVDGTTTVTNLEELIELDPSTIGLNQSGAFATHITISSGAEQHQYEVCGFNQGNGYLRCKRINES